MNLLEIRIPTSSDSYSKRATFIQSHPALNMLLDNQFIYTYLDHIIDVWL